MSIKSIISGAFMILLASSVSCPAQTNGQGEEDASVSEGLTEVYYFHYERRCATCLAVENESEKALKELYPEKVESGEITFLSVNLEDDSNDALAEKLNVTGQSLIIVKDGKQDNLTNTAFMHARTNPDKLKSAIKESIEKL